jgi:hypothetical protein
MVWYVVVHVSLKKVEKGGAMYHLRKNTGMGVDCCLAVKSIISNTDLNFINSCPNSFAKSKYWGFFL